MLTYNDAEKILAEYGQEHILKYFGELTETEQRSLLDQIENIDFSLLDNLDKEKNSNLKRGVFKPLDAVTTEDIASNREDYLKVGLDAIKNGKTAAVLLAGGQGTRLGFDKPKGMFNVGVDRELYIFECLINNLKKVTDMAGTMVPLYIMTSEINNRDTVDFLEEHDYFGYDKEFVRFFIQDMAPAVDFNGKIYMESKSKICSSPNGNGGWFSSLVRAGLLDEIKEKGVEWINVFAVDNVLQQIADPMFIGAVIRSGCESGGKVVSKAAPEEKVGVLCLEDDKPSIVEYYEMTPDMINLRKENGQLAYKYGVILNYLFSVEKLMNIYGNDLPVHIVEKKIPHMDENGRFITPEKPNGHKFETLVLDMVHQHDSCLPYEVVRNKEFAPIKNAKGVDSVESARELLKENGIEL